MSESLNDGNNEQMLAGKVSTVATQVGFESKKIQRNEIITAVAFFCKAISQYLLETFKTLLIPSSPVFPLLRLYPE